MMARNEWFQRHALRVLKEMTPYISRLPRRPTLLAFSYAARELFRYAKSQGWLTVLEQIDPGPIEEDLVAERHARYPKHNSKWQRAPAVYWDSWREECDLSDYILVNSQWSATALQSVGIPNEKISITPLTFESPTVSRVFAREYPESFSSERPLRVLFLGTFGVRKGAVELLEAANLMRDEAVEFWIVGPSEFSSMVAQNEAVRMVGAVTRKETAQYYERADLFIFPTLSDGFGLTQLEAQAWKLPIIASRNCGVVVNNQVNGIVLREVSAEEIASALRLCIRNPAMLSRFSEASCHQEAEHLQPLLRFLNSRLDD
jgi:glycosyltransferase involved in cell wall biosynthesis